MDKYVLIPDLKAWDDHNGGEISPEGWASCIGSYSLAIAYATLFWPRFTEIQGMVFREGVTESHVNSWMASAGNDTQAVEATINHLHVVDIQAGGSCEPASEPQVRFLGETVRAAWAAKLAIDYPDRKFVVELIEGSSTNLREYVLQFYQSNHA
jgi:hypothetical protein